MRRQSPGHVEHGDRCDSLTINIHQLIMYISSHYTVDELLDCCIADSPYMEPWVSFSRQLLVL